MFLMYFSIAVFLIVLILFAFELIHRTPAALVGGVLVVLAGALSAEGAVEAVHWETLGLLVGMMILVGILKDSGLFGYMAIQSAQFARGRPGLTLVYLGLITGVLSAFLDNVTTVLLIFPVTLVIARIIEQDPVPYLITEVIASNIGGAATLVGDPPNIIVGTQVDSISFIDFIVSMAPVVIFILLITMGIVWVVHGRRLQTSEEHQSQLMAMQAGEEIKDRGLLIRAGSVMGATVVLFFLQTITGFNPAVVALGGAGVAMTICGKQVENALHEVEWPTILFFVGLFVLVGALEHTGFIDIIASTLASATQGLASTSVLVIWGSAIISGIVDNIPWTLTMVPVIEQLLESVHESTGNSLWWSLLLGADFGGNLTMIGASANVVVYGMARREGLTGFTFWRFTAWGAPLTLIALAIATVYTLLFLV